MQLTRVHPSQGSEKARLQSRVERLEQERQDHPWGPLAAPGEEGQGPAEGSGDPTYLPGSRSSRGRSG